MSDIILTNSKTTIWALFSKLHINIWLCDGRYNQSLMVKVKEMEK